MLYRVGFAPIRSYVIDVFVKLYTQELFLYFCFFLCLIGYSILYVQLSVLNPTMFPSDVNLFKTVRLEIMLKVQFSVLKPKDY